MDADAKRLAALEEELRRDLDAIARVKQLMALKNGSLSPPDSRQLKLAITRLTDAEDDDEAPIQSLRGTVEKIINADPTIRWTTQKVLAHLQNTGFPLKAQKPIYSVGQALQKLAGDGKIRIVRKGVGSQPNIYKGKVVEQEAHSEGGDIVKESVAG